MRDFDDHLINWQFSRLLSLGTFYTEKYMLSTCIYGIKQRAHSIANIFFICIYYLCYFLKLSLEYGDCLPLGSKI